MHATGQGAVPDLAQALTWLQQAEHAGVGAATRYVKSTAARMNPAQLAQAQCLAVGAALGA